MTTWTPKTENSNSWTAQNNELLRSFDPNSFDLSPSFDTGSTAGVWGAQSQPSGTWTPE